MSKILFNLPGPQGGISYIEENDEGLNDLILNGAVKQAELAGTAAAGTEVSEVSADGVNFQAIITMDSVLPAIAGGAALGVGVLAYTLPAGAVIVESASMSMAIQQTEGNITADTPEVGLGNVIASGAVAVLSGTPAFENVLTGQVAADCDGTPTVKTVADQVLVIEAADAHTIYFNVADTWAAGGDAGALISGTIIINYRKM